MLTKLSITMFQSIRAVVLELGKLTVLVGPSNSGKSATLRALRTLAQNASSPSFVTTGAKASDIEVEFSDGVSVSLRRGKAQSTYAIHHAGDVEPYPKSGVGVPADIQAVLRLATIEGESLHFAGQFDRPFLLGSTGTQIAKVVGDLTNISLLYAAVREANRRRLDFASKLKVRQGDVERIREEVARYRSLPSLLDAAAEAGSMVSEAEEARAKARRLEARIDEVVQASDRLSEVKVVDIPEIDWGAIVTTAQQAERLRGLIVQVDAARMGEERAAEDAESFAAEAAEVDRQAHALLAEAGTCPLCGQSTKELASA